MSVPPEASAPHRPKEDPESLALRGRPRPVARFRRGLIVGLAGALSAALAAVSWLALQPAGLRVASEAKWTEQALGAPAPDALAEAPKTYGEVPRLGPPLPGDLGRPILEHRRSLAEPVEPVEASGGEASRYEVAAERERRAQAIRSARTSPLILQRAGGGAASERAPPDPARPVIGDAGETDRPNSTISADQKHKLDFVRSSAGGDPHQFRASSSPWTLSAGTLVPASLITGLNSDLPGIVLAQVTENVRDSATGRAILIPQGARLLGRYDNAVAFGQRRALLVWTQILFPDGSSLDLDNVPATDGSGFAGLEDRVDAHNWQMIKGIALSTLLGLGTQLSLGSSESELVRAVRESAQQGAASAGDRITSRNLDVQPTIVVRPGWPVRAILSKDLILRPWRG